MTPPILELQSVTKRFGDFVAVNDVSLTVAPGEFITLLGASGSGKTTTLRMIAGFEHPDAGEILMDGRPLTGLPPNRRDLNTVFQQYALFPHLTVRHNVGYGLRMRGTPAPELDQRVGQALDMVQLGGLAGRLPRQLSGGQQQRVALARALVNRPKVLLLDEPLGALDLKLRKEMQLELKHLNRQLGLTFLYVTHDQEEALTMSDRIALMRAGRIEQLSGPREMYERPHSRYVADFIGETNLLGGVPARRLGDSARLTVGGQEIQATAADSVRDGEPAWLTVRPEFVRVAGADASGPRLRATVTETVFTGQVTRVFARLQDGSALTMHWPATDRVPDPGTAIDLTWPPERGLCVGD
jgi:spermidine/putrescine transport system ATP-binding protein